MLYSSVANDVTGPITCGQFQKQHARFELEVRKRPKRRRCGDAVLPHLAARGVTHNGGRALPLSAPRDPPAKRHLCLANMKRRLRGEEVLVQALGTAEVLPGPAEQGGDKVLRL